MAFAITYTILVFCISGLLQTCGCDISVDDEDDNNIMSQPPRSQLQNCSGGHTTTPVAGFRLVYRATRRMVLSTKCWHDDEPIPFFSHASSSSPSIISRVTDNEGITWGCLNHSVVSGLKLRQKEKASQITVGAAGSAERGGGGGIKERGEMEVSSCLQLPPGNSYSLDYCSWTRWLSRRNESNGSVFVYPLPRPWVVRRIHNHLVRRDCRSYRYKLEICHLTSLWNSSFSVSCHLPTFSHGNITAINHTHSIIQNHTHFRIKVHLSCEEGYQEVNGRKIGSVCRNGIWTHLPLCEKCDDEGCDFAPNITTSEVSIGFVAGSNITLDCEATGRPRPSIYWHRGRSNGRRESLQNYTHFVTHGNGSLTIVNVSNSDSGSYVCWVQNSAGSDAHVVDIFNCYCDELGPPAIYHWSPLHILTPDHTPILHCHAVSYPPPAIAWSFLPLSSSSLLSSASTFVRVYPSSSSITDYFNGTLLFDSLHEGYSGLYRCQAANEFGTVSMETIVFFNPDTEDDGEVPVINSTNWITNYTASVGSHLELHCPATSSSQRSVHFTGPLHYLWMKKGGRAISLTDNGSPGSSSLGSNSSSPRAGPRVWQTGNGSLVISEVKQKDEGRYWCLVWNHAGITMEITRITIGDVSDMSPPPSPTATVVTSSTTVLSTSLELNLICFSMYISITISLVSSIY